jgi:hypothetical protein
MHSAWHTGSAPRVSYCATNSEDPNATATACSIRKFSTRRLAVPSPSQLWCPYLEYTILLWSSFRAKWTLHRSDGFILTSTPSIPHVNVMLTSVSTRQDMMSRQTRAWSTYWRGWSVRLGIFIYGSNLPANHLSHTVEFGDLTDDYVMWPRS